MRLIKQFTILVGVCFLGEALHRLIPLPVPANIYGLLLMFIALQAKIFPLEAVEEISDDLLSVMPLLFIPSTVGLILAWPILKNYWLQFITIGVLSTIAVFFAAGHVTQLVIRLSSHFKKNPPADDDSREEQNV
ncbi:MAG: CidA/LrgA family protein [Treponema sp.]|nr:CidA/LrgA family protein [Treponema sp.]